MKVNIIVSDVLSTTVFQSEYLMRIKNIHLNVKLWIHIRIIINCIPTIFLIHVFAQYQICSCALINIIGHVGISYIITINATFSKLLCAMVH